MKLPVGIGKVHVVGSADGDRYFRQEGDATCIHGVPAARQCSFCTGLSRRSRGVWTGPWYLDRGRQFFRRSYMARMPFPRDPRVTVLNPEERTFFVSVSGRTELDTRPS